MRGNLEHLHLQRQGALQDAEVGWTLDGNYIARFRYGAETQLDRLERSRCDGHLARSNARSGLRRPACDVAAEGFHTGRKVVMRAVQRLASDHPPQHQIQTGNREELRAGVAGAEGDVCRIGGGLHDLGEDGIGSGDGRLHPGCLEARLGDQLRIRRPHVESRLGPRLQKAAVFEQQICL